MKPNNFLHHFDPLPEECTCVIATRFDAKYCTRRYAEIHLSHCLLQQTSLYALVDLGLAMDAPAFQHRMYLQKRNEIKRKKQEIRKLANKNAKLTATNVSSDLPAEISVTTNSSVQSTRHSDRITLNASSPSIIASRQRNHKGIHPVSSRSSVLPSLPSSSSKPELPFTAHYAGTRGYRAPELLIGLLPTIAIDIFAAGIILLSILTHLYPLFRPGNDTDALMEYRHFFGSAAFRKAEHDVERRIVVLTNVARQCSDKNRNDHQSSHQPVTAISSPTKSRKRAASTATSPTMSTTRPCTPFEILRFHPRVGTNWHDTLWHLCSRCLDVNPITRITAAEALQHPFFKQIFEEEHIQPTQSNEHEK